MKAKHSLLFAMALLWALNTPAAGAAARADHSEDSAIGASEGLYLVDPSGRERLVILDPSGLAVDATRTLEAGADLDAPALTKLTVVSTIVSTVVINPSNPVIAPAPQLIATCSSSIKNQANTGGPCLVADSTPKLGRLYPLSQDLNVDSSGKVGIGTSSRADRLTVNGVIKTSGGLVFPDATVQTTATATGSAGPSGSAGPQGPTGATGPPGQNGLAAVSGQPGPALTINGIGAASVSAGGSTVTISVPGTLCTYANKTYSKDAFCYTSGNYIPCSFGARSVELRCKADGSWQVVTSSQCFDPSAGPLCGQ